MTTKLSESIASDLEKFDRAGLSKQQAVNWITHRNELTEDEAWWTITEYIEANDTVTWNND